MKPSYIKIEMSEEFRKDIENIVHEICNNNKDFDPVPISSLHITLVFFGNALQHKGNKFMSDVISHMNKFNDEFLSVPTELCIDQFDFFGRSHNLLVLKLKAKNNPSFIDECIKYKLSCVKFGASEENYFTPHITLGKINKSNSINLDGIELLKKSSFVVNNLSIVGV